MLSYFGHVSRRESLPKLQAAANKAIELDETLAEAHVAQAVYKEAERDWAGAQRHYRRAIELNPAHANAHFRYGGNLIAVGRFEEAIAELKRALELDPVSVAFSNILGLAYHYARRYEEAIVQYRKTLAMDPGFATAHLYLGQLYIAKSMYPEALAEIKEAVKLMQEAPLAVSALGLAYAGSSDREAARKVLERMLAERALRGDYPASQIAIVYLGLGQKDRAFEWLQTAVEEWGGGMAFLKVNPMFDPLRSDPRFTELLRRMNLAP